MPTLDPNLYTVAWIAPLEIEVQAALAMLDKVHTEGFPVSPGDDYVFHAGEIYGHNIVVATLAAGQPYGTSSATSLAAHVRKSFPNLWFGFLVGVAAGLPNLACSPPRDIRLGDVVVALSEGDYPAILPYGLGKQKGASGFELLRYGHSLPQTTRVVCSAIGKIKAKEQGTEAVIRYYNDAARKDTRFSDPGQENDIFYLSCDDTPVPRLRRPDAKRTRVWYGSIGSGDQLLKSNRDRDELRDKYNVIGLEMEAAGVMNEIPVGNIRGVCDYGDERKNKDWQPYAAAMAAAFAKAVLSEITPKYITQPPVFTDKDNSCLRDLLVADPDTELRRIESMKGGLLDDSFRWVLGNAEFQKWRSNHQSQLLCIKGDPGKGKTMLMVGIIKELSQHIQSQPSQSIAYFLCQATDPRLSNATSILRSLIYMLIRQQPHLISYLREKYDTNPKLFEVGNPFYSLSAIFENMIQYSTHAITYLLVDALDECETGLSDLLQLIARTKSVSATQVKWIVSSRNRDDIEQAIDFGNEETKLNLELNANYISEAVAAYIDYKVSRLKSLQRNRTLLEQVKEELRCKSDGTFLWVALVIQEMQKCWRSAAMIKLLEGIPRGLTPLYDRILQQIQRFENLDRELCMLVLSIVILGYRPLHLHELCRLAGLCDQQDGLGDLENIVDMCGSFLIIREDYVYLIHQSAKDYFSDVKVSAAIFPSGPSAIHYRIFSKSLENISSKLRRNIYNLDDPGAPVSEIATFRPYPDPLFDLRYSCTYWLDHLFVSIRPEKPEALDNQVLCFFKQHLLHWLESLGFISELRHGILSLKRLSGRQSQHQTIFKEAERFASANAVIIQEAPLQIYSAALVFCPQESLTKRIYWDQRSNFIKQVYVIQESWDPCVQVLEGHEDSVKAVAFSPGGQTVASASNDRTIRLWDTATGAEKQTFKGHRDLVHAVVFSPDGQIVASASADHTILLWDTATGAKQTLEGHRGSVHAVAFSPDGQIVASASSDQTILFWDMATGAKQILEGHRGSVHAVAFSPDGQIVASTSADQTIQLWGTANGAKRQTLQGHSGSVYAVAFSPDGQMVASASADRTIQLWDTANGAKKQTLKGHRGWVNTVAFSPNGQIVVSASSDWTIRLWNIASGSEKQTLKGHRGWVHGVAVFPNGHTVASASSDGTIRLWDTATATGSGKQTLKGLEDSVHAMVFSPDGQTVASTSTNWTIQLWDAVTGIKKQTLKGHKGSVHAIIFSPDGQMIASTSSDWTTRLWDAATGDEKQVLRGHRGWVNTVAFSPNGQVIASASSDWTTRLWDTATGTEKQVLRGHRDWVNTVAFSPNEQVIVSVSSDRTIRLWDTATGTEKQVLRGHSDWVNTVAFSPNGQVVMSASSDWIIRLWDTAAGTEKQILRGHSDWVNVVAFSPDGLTVASASNDRTIRLWDTATGAEKRIYHSSATVEALSFSANGYYLNSNRGSLPLDFMASDSSNNLIFVHEKWVCRNGHHLIWLPPQYRETGVLARENTVILGHKSGALTFLWLT